MRLVVVGSVARAWPHPEDEAAREAIRNAIERHRAAALAAGEEFAVGSGRSPGGGVDVWAEDYCRREGIEFVPFAPADGWLEAVGRDRWERFYRPRNQAMADWATHLRIASARSRTYGSGWTRSRADAQGKPTEGFVPNAPSPEWSLEFLRRTASRRAARA